MPTQPLSPPAHAADAWIEAMVARYGPVVGGADLRGLLGYRTRSAFERAFRLDTVAVPVFRMPGRRGYFALTHEAAAALLNARAASRQQT